MIITPYSKLATQSQTLTDYASCKHFFKCNEVAGATTMADAVTGGTTPTTAIVKNDAYSIEPGTLVNAAFSGTFATVATANSAVLLVVADYAAAATVTLGNNTGSVPRLIAGCTIGGLMREGTLSVSGGNNAANATKGFGVLKDTGSIFTSANVRSFDVSSSAWAIAAGAAISTLADITPASEMSIGTGFTKVYGIALFVFTTSLPKDTQAALAWMSNEWRNGNKVIYPGWKGLV